MQIGALARTSGLAASTIRFYESKGLLPPASRQANGYRDYPPQAPALLALIASAQQAGFTLDEIRAILPPDLRDWQHQSLVAALTRKLADINAMQARLAQNQAQLESLLVLMESKPEGMSCQDNAARVLEQLGQATGGERGLCSKDFWQAP